MELWGGAECSIIRIDHRWRAQGDETGHDRRDGDFELIAKLGIKTLRHSFLWEQIAPDRPAECDFTRSDRRVAMLEAANIDIVAGLLHHGSGPGYTNLLDPQFSRKFADFAFRVASRYPQIERWTPINEPLTTARFSCLYGHWYPHHRDYTSFLRALVHQCDGIRRAMAAIRSINPNAQLLQTEDLGKVFSTPPLSEQADHENDRRWLSLDLLAGRVDRAHPFYRFFRDANISAAELEAFHDGVARPDMIGVNHYLTSERFLDHRLELYPDLAPGGNGREAYVDAEAIRVAELAAECGIAARLSEVWQRYSIPMAITEVHHGCTREEQLRWFVEVWRESAKVRQRGVDVRAITLWSLFGAVDWRSLVTRDEGHYDPGAFDVRAPAPRETVLAKAAKAYARGQSFAHPVLKTEGWWRKADRLYPWCKLTAQINAPAESPLLITGATGTLGQAIARVAAKRGLPFHLSSRSELDIEDPCSIAAALARINPWAIVNAAGFVRVADAEHEVGASMAANASGTGNLARACRARDIPLVTFSSDLVFNGLQGRAYVETDQPRPVGVYGHSKLMGELLASAAGGRSLIIRTSAFFGPWDRFNFAWSVLAAISRGEPVSASASDIVSPTFVPDLSNAALDLLIDGETGIWHLANQGRTTWYAFACAVAEGAGFSSERIFAHEGTCSRNRALVSERGQLLRPLADALADYLRDMSATPVVKPAPNLTIHSAATNMV